MRTCSFSLGTRTSIERTRGGGGSYPRASDVASECGEWIVVEFYHCMLCSMLQRKTHGMHVLSSLVIDLGFNDVQYTFIRAR